MKFVIKIIFLVLCGLFLSSFNSIADEINSNKCNMPLDFLNLKAVDLIKLDKCFEKDKKISFQNILKNPKTKNLKPSFINKYLEETMLNHHTKEISNQNYERLFSASLRHINKTKFFKWFLYKEKNSYKLISFAEKYFNTDPLVTTTIFQYVINNRRDVEIDNIKKIISKYMSLKEFNDLIIESINSSDISIRKRSCAYIILRSKKNDLENNFLLRFKEKVVSGNRLYFACYFKLLDQLDKKEDIIEFVKQNKLIDWNSEETSEIINSYLYLSNEIFSPNEFFNFYKKVKNDDYYSYSVFINKIYPNTFQLKNKNRRELFPYEKCLIKNIKDCAQENQNIKFLNFALSNAMKIIDALNMKIEPFNDFLKEILKDDTVSLLFKADLLNTLDFDIDELRKRNQKIMFPLILKFKRNMYIKYARTISQNDELSKKLRIMPPEEFASVFNFKNATTKNLVYEDWFIEFVKQINETTSYEYLNNLNGIMYHFILSEHTTEALTFVNRAIARIKDIGLNQNKFKEEYLQLLWHASYLEKLIENGNPYEKIIMGINLTSKEKNTNSKKLMFEDLRINYLHEQDNLKDAFILAEKKLKIEKDIALEILNKHADEYWKIMSQLQPCVTVLTIYSIKKNEQIPKYIKNDFKEYCSKNFKLFNNRYPIINFMILDETLYREKIRINDGKQENLSPSLISKLNLFMNDKNTDQNFKTIISILLKLHFQKTINAKLLKHPLTVEKINFDTNKNKFLDDFTRYYEFYKLHEQFTNKKKNFSDLLKFVNDRLLIRAKQHYIESNYTTHFYHNFLVDKYSHKLLENNNVEEFYRMRNLMKFSQPDKIISTKNSKNLSSDKNLFKDYTRNLTRKAFLVDTLFFENTKIEEKENLRQELININNKIKITSTELKKHKINFNSISSLQKKLSKKDVIIDFHFYQQPSKLSILIIKKNSIDHKIIKNVDGLRDEINQFKNSIKPELNNYIFKHGFYLYKKLISDHLSEEIDNIYFLPDKILYALPFHAMPIVEENNTTLKEENKWLGLKYKISFLTTINQEKTEKRKNEYNFFGVGDPVFEANNNDTKTVLGNLVTNKRGLSLNLKGYQRLPNTSLEIKSIASMSVFDNSKILLRKDATETNIKNSKKIENASIISFATHGLVSGEMNTHSEPGLLMTKSQIDNDNGYLTMTEISSLNLKSDLVILSACNTSSSMSKNTSPFSGLASAFLSAGSNKVLASMWSVESKSTYLLMKTILSKINKKKRNIKEAQFSGVKSFIKKYSKYKSPYYWGGFMLFGTTL